jgi:hypothetical protein
MTVDMKRRVTIGVAVLVVGIVLVGAGVTTSYATTVPEGLAIHVGLFRSLCDSGPILFDHNDFD